MSPQQKFYWLIGGIGGLLVSASIIGMILRNRAGSAESHAVIDNLNARMRQRYGAAEGERLRAQWHALKQQRYDLKCGR